MLQYNTFVHINVCTHQAITDKWNLFFCGKLYVKRVISIVCIHKHSHTNDNGHGQIELNSKCFNANLQNDTDTGSMLEMELLPLTICIRSIIYIRIYLVCQS